MDNIFHKIFNAITAGVALAFGFTSNIPAAVQTLMIVIVLDLVMGFFAAYLQNMATFRAFAVEAQRKLGIGVVVALTYVLTSLVINPETGDTIGQATAGFYIAVESISILQKTNAIGIPIPDFLRAALDKLSSQNQMRRSTDRES
jgi:toxin secretion/phage lysis holin